MLDNAEFDRILSAVSDVVGGLLFSKEQAADEAVILKYAQLHGVADEHAVRLIGALVGYSMNRHGEAIAKMAKETFRFGLGVPPKGNLQ